MKLKIDARCYADFLRHAYDSIHADGDYITGLDAATGDGDHWANLDQGFEKLADLYGELAVLPLAAQFQKIGMTMMSTIGGSSGVLYGGAYMAASKILDGKAAMDLSLLARVLDTMLTDMMARGKSERGWKTMIDALAPAVDVLRAASDSAPIDELAVLERAAEAAEAGAEATRHMAAVRGRASYRADRGVGHLDPGAVTMARQIRSLFETCRQAL